MARIASLVVVFAVLLLVSSPASAGGEVRRSGSCSGGPGHWVLRVRRDDGALRVRFKIDDVPAGQAWQIFLSNDGTRIFSGTRTSTASGEVRVSKRTPNRRGSDRIAASGVNTRTGTTCEGSLTY